MPGRDVTCDRRQVARANAAYSVRLVDSRGRLVARGRTANISESGLYVLVRSARKLQQIDEVRVQIALPRPPSRRRARREPPREVLYLCRVARREDCGGLLGLGLELLRKLA